MYLWKRGGSKDPNLRGKLREYVDLWKNRHNFGKDMKEQVEIKSMKNIRSKEIGTTRWGKKQKDNMKRSY